MEILQPAQPEIITKEKIGNIAAAKLMLKILTDTYGRHNLMASIEKTSEDIGNDRLKPFFMTEGGQILCCSALIYAPSCVEIGRTANAEKGRNGGKLMLHAVNEWKSDGSENRPLVAEIRMATKFEGVDGGQGSQATLLKKTGMIPNAFLPAFHHPGTNGIERQEIFCFASLEKTKSERVSPETVIVPNLLEMNIDLLSRLLEINEFNTRVKLTNLPNKAPLNFLKINTIPFSILKPDAKGKHLEEIDKVQDSDNPFTLATVNSFNPDLARVSQNLIDNKFILLGLTAPHQGPLELLFGRLNKCLLVPTEPMREFPLIDPDIILRIHKQLIERM